MIRSLRDRFDYRGFGRRLGAARVKLSLTEKEMAEAAGVTVPTWRKYEATGKGRCTSAVVLLANRLNVSPKFLICGEGPIILAAARGRPKRHRRGERRA
jgi:transcriptional regulator with XRE-family HTH domain